MPRVVTCGLFEMMKPYKCTGNLANISIAAFISGLIFFVIAVHLYRKRDFRENREDLFRIVLLFCVSVILLGYGLEPKQLVEPPSDYLTYSETDIALGPGYELNDEVVMQVTNKGTEPFNVGNFTVYYGLPNHESMSYSAIERKVPEWALGGDGNQCFTSNMSNGSEMDKDILRPGESANCPTGIRFPGKQQSIGIRVEADESGYFRRYTCDVDSQSARTC